jgi:outer membrane protein OmpA-like peptidoglycan-associated protein
MISLNEIKKLLDENPDGSLVIEGHTSSDGEAEANLALSQNRAAAVKAFLVNLGVNPDRLKTEGYGEERPIA